MAIPSTLPVRSRIRSAALYGLRNRIISGGTAIRYSSSGNTTVSSEGYYNTISRAFDPSRTFEQFDEYPCVNVFVDNEDCDNVSNVQIDQNQGLLHNSFILQMDCFLNDNNDPALAQDKILHDIQKYFGINYYIPDENGVATAFNCYYDSSLTFGTDRTTPNCGITIRYRVWYRQQLTNPSQSG